ncbi:hypothetical protein ALC60_02133 [Trachymyrmex zeteki]|uniref:Uncharacterized protein n=1 Tax=Mycetomoellerius zeteki TaxID=64791 RepID=A0A151XEQ1_9HYME|nr:hypothetical protein ALC60_02133 [Trachymyrmex zeteki]
MADHRANVEDIVFENIRNVDPEHLKHIIDEVFEEMEIDFEEIMDQESSDEEVLSDDTGCASDLSEYNMDHVEKHVSSPEIRALNIRTKHCMIQCYYTTGGTYTVCASCIINISDTDIDINTENSELYRCTDLREWYKRRINLLYVQNDNAGHFAWIKNLSRLVRSQITRNKNKKFFCDRPDCYHELVLHFGMATGLRKCKIIIKKQPLHLA